MHVFDEKTEFLFFLIPYFPVLPKFLLASTELVKGGLGTVLNHLQFHELAPGHELKVSPWIHHCKMSSLYSDCQSNRRSQRESWNRTKRKTHMNNER